MAKKSKKQRKEKAKRRSYIAKISSDGKITKKEGQKAAKKGISLSSIENRNIGAYRDAVRSYDKAPKQNKAGRINITRPTFEPLKIKRGAYTALTPPKTSAPAANKDPETIDPVDTTETVEPPVDVVEAVDYGQMIADSNAENAKMIQDLMASNQAAAQQRASEYEAQFNRMREEQAAAQAEYQRQAEERDKQFELAQRTSLGNQARAGQQAIYQLGGAPGMKRGGTFGFRRRRRQLMGGISSAVAAGAGGGTLNV